MINRLKTEYEVVILPELEADDAMGIYATMLEDTCICSPDKDMRQIPGALYDMKEHHKIDECEGRNGITSRHSLAIKQMAMVAYLALALKEPYSSLIRMATSGRPSLRHLMRRIFPKMSLFRTHAWQRSLPLMNMTFPTNASDFGPPPPITSLTMEQEFKIRQITDALNRPETQKEDIITVFLALQRQCFVLSNNMSQLLKQWNLPPTTLEETLKSGTSSETKN